MIKKITKYILSSKIVLAVIGLFLKITFTAFTGLLLTNDLVAFVSLLSFTAPLNITLIVFMLVVDGITLSILFFISQAYFKDSSSFTAYFWWSVSVFVIFFGVDIILSIQPKNGVPANHFVTGAILLLRYLIYFVFVIALVLRAGKLTSTQKEALFMNYDNFFAARFLSKEKFLSSRILYTNKGIGICIIVILMVNFMSLEFYTNTFLFFLQVVVLLAAEIYLLIFISHQLRVMFKNYSNLNSVQS